jgi:hypothetical protein
MFSYLAELVTLTVASSYLDSMSTESLALKVHAFDVSISFFRFIKIITLNGGASNIISGAGSNKAELPCTVSP